MANFPQAPKHGQSIVAWATALVDWLRAMRTVRGGAGIDVQQTDGGVVISLARPGRMDLYEGVITAAPAAPDGDLPPESCVYSYKVVSWAGSEVTGALPDYGRAVDAARVVPCSVNDQCLVAVAKDAQGNRTSKLFVLTERAATFECAPGPGLAPGADGGAGGGGGGGAAADFEAIVAAVAARVTQGADELGVVSWVDLGGSWAGSQTITTLGTIATGVWNGTLIGLAYGGTGANLAATGGSNQFVKQAGAGAAFTVGQMTVADLAPVVSTCFITGTVANNANPTAWADVTGLSFSLASGATYAFEFELATVASATTNFGLYGVNGPTNSLLVVNVSRAGNSAGTGGCFSSTTAYDTGNPPASVNSSGALPVRISGIITTTASGTLIVRQKNTTNGAAVTVNAGSWGRLTRIA